MLENYIHSFTWNTITTGMFTYPTGFYTLSYLLHYSHALQIAIPHWYQWSPFTFQRPAYFFSSPLVTVSRSHFVCHTLLPQILAEVLKASNKWFVGVNQSLQAKVSFLAILFPIRKGIKINFCLSKRQEFCNSDRGWCKRKSSLSLSFSRLLDIYIG